MLTRMRQRSIKLNDIKYKKGEQVMKCGFCKADMEEKNVTYTEDIEQGVIVVRHVPAQVCTECGNIWYSGTIAVELEKLVDRLVLSCFRSVNH